MRVIKVESVQQDAVDEGGVAQWQALGVAEDRARAFPTECNRTRQCPFGERVLAGGKAAADRIEDEQPRPLAYSGGNIAQLQRTHEIGKTARGDRCGDLRCDWLGTLRGSIGHALVLPTRCKSMCRP